VKRLKKHKYLQLIYFKIYRNTINKLSIRKYFICGSLSNIFDKKGNRPIGLNEVGESSILSDLANRIIFENVHKIGKYDSVRTTLNI